MQKELLAAILVVLFIGICAVIVAKKSKPTTTVKPKGGRSKYAQKEKML